MRREHVVVGGDDADVGLVHQPQSLLVFTRTTAGNAVGKVGALQCTAVWAVAVGGGHLRQVTFAGRAATGDQTVGYLENAGMHGVDSRLQVAIRIVFLSKY